MRKTTILALIFILYSFSVISQGKFGKATPQVADFIKYGDIPVSLFHGHMSLEVPIYHYKDRDFDIPIKLVYTAEGFKPSKRSDLVGLDWTLIAGGCITREIYGAPDDSNPIGNQEGEYGYYLTVKEGGYDKNKIWNFEPPEVQPALDVYPYYCLKKKDVYFVDFQPDLFLFNFNGHSGHFMIDDNGKAISTNRGYKIDISNLKEQFLESNTLDTGSSITIITPEGYSYEFGGDGSNLEYSISFKDLVQAGNGFAEDKVYPRIMVWHLSRITAPNGRVAKFNYIEHENNLLTPSSSLWQSSETETLPNSMFQYGTATKKAVLVSIEIEDVTIKFNTSVENTLKENCGDILYSDYFFQSHKFYNKAIYQLDSITVKYNNNNLKFRYDLSYENRDRRRFLNEVILNDGSKYTFTYNHSGKYPPPGKGVNHENEDIYGFWKKNNSNSSLGLMSSVKYPTGGYSTFDYEKQEYSREVEFNAVQMKKSLIEASNMVNDTIPYTPGHEPDTLIHEPTDPPILNIPGYYIINKYNHYGSRIKKVVHYTAYNKIASEKEYIYKTKIKDGESSGILYQSTPVIGYHIVSGEKIYAVSSIWLKNYNIDEPAIGYSKVFEQYADSSYCEYSFTDWHSNPDGLGSKVAKTKFIDENFIPTEYDNRFLVLTGHSRVASYSDQRGRLKSKLYYAPKSTTPELTEKFDYLNMINFAAEVFTHVDDIVVELSKTQIEPQYVVTFSSMLGGGIARKIYLDKYHPVTRHKKIDKNGVTTINETLYNDYHLPKIENTIIMESGDTLRNNFYYPFDYTGAPYSSMVSRNRISPIIEQVKQRIRNGNSNEIERLKTDYTAVKDNLFLPANKQSSVGGNPLKEVMSYDKYDDKGNILQTTGVDGIKTAYKWSDDGLYLLAEVWNATYDEIKNISVYDLRNQFSGAQVTTYTYKPLVGMTSKTDPRGITTYYEYDSFGRLEFIKDNQQNIIEKYEYHYKPQ